MGIPWAHTSEIGCVVLLLFADTIGSKGRTRGGTYLLLFLYTWSCIDRVVHTLLPMQYCPYQLSLYRQLSMWTQSFPQTSKSTCASVII